ncbi:hypothetical protein, partial [Pseudomonas aeruginosa]|uniref:hypothetical protein n=1 Tax=Pseudomonas aeruginosa TaxID=287 RepID=UPI0039C27A9B
NILKKIFNKDNAITLVTLAIAIGLLIGLAVGIPMSQTKQVSNVHNQTENSDIEMKKIDSNLIASNNNRKPTFVFVNIAFNYFF